MAYAWKKFNRIAGGHVQRETPSTPFNYKPLCYFVAFILLGLAVCVAYVIYADAVCKIDTDNKQPIAITFPYLFLPYDYHKIKEGGHKSDYGRKHEARMPDVGPRIDNPKPKEIDRKSDADSPNGNDAPHPWAYKFICEAKAADIALVFFTWCLVVATLGLVWATIKLWEAGERQIDLATKSAVSQAVQTRAAIREAKRSADAAMNALGSDRAWMVFDDVQMAVMIDSHIDGMHVDEGIGVQIRWRNKGRSPAIKADVCRNFKMLPYYSKEVPMFNEYDGEDGFKAPIGPECSVLCAPAGIGDAGRATFFNKESAIIIYSSIKYRDIFNSGVIRKSEICLRIAYDGKREGGDGRKIHKWRINPIGPQNTAS